LPKPIIKNLILIKINFILRMLATWNHLLSKFWPKLKKKMTGTAAKSNK
jgi:hypothetical protein